MTRFNRLRETLLGLVLLFSGASACRDRDQRNATLPERIAAVAACYELVALPSGAAVDGLLARFRLWPDSANLEIPRPGTLRLELLTTTDSLMLMRLHLTLWRIDSISDTIRASVGDGFTAQFFRGAPAPGGHLVGMTGLHSDAEPFESNVRAARAQRIECPASVGPSARWSRP